MLAASGGLVEGAEVLIKQGFGQIGSYASGRLPKPRT